MTSRLSVSWLIKEQNDINSIELKWAFNCLFLPNPINIQLLEEFLPLMFVLYTHLNYLGRIFKFHISDINSAVKWFKQTITPLKRYFVYAHVPKTKNPFLVRFFSLSKSPIYDIRPKIVFEYDVHVYQKHNQKKKYVS